MQIEGFGFKCKECGGKGKVPQDCSVCKGSGKVECVFCKGTGKFFYQALGLGAGK